MPTERVPKASERIEEASRWVDVALRELDHEADRFHEAHERTRQVLESFLLRLQVLSISSADPRRAADEVQLFEAAYRDTLRVAKDAYDAARSRSSPPAPPARKDLPDAPEFRPTAG